MNSPVNVRGKVLSTTELVIWIVYRSRILMPLTSRACPLVNSFAPTSRSKARMNGEPISGVRMRSIVYLASSDVISRPWWNRIPRCSRNVRIFPSPLTDHDSAAPGSMASVFGFWRSSESKMVILTAIAREVLVSAGSRLAGSLLSARRKCPPETGVWAVADPITPADSSAPRHTVATTVRRFHVDVFMAHLRPPPASFRCLPRTGPLHLSPAPQRSRM